MESHDDLVGIDLTIWQPWARQLVDLIDEVRAVVAAHLPDDEKRTRLAVLGPAVHALLERLVAEPDLPGVFGQALRVLRQPADAEPTHIADAIERLTALAHMVCEERSPAPAKRVRRRGCAVVLQPELPGLEPLTQGAPT